MNVVLCSSVPITSIAVYDCELDGYNIARRKIPPHEMGGLAPAQPVAIIKDGGCERGLDEKLTHSAILSILLMRYWSTI